MVSLSTVRYLSRIVRQARESLDDAFGQVSGARAREKGVKHSSTTWIRWLALFLLFTWPKGPRAQTQPIQYYYDDLGRLVTMVDQSGNVVTYNYDAVGNITSISRSTVTLGSLAIFDFNPQSGPVGIPVTIRGQGFSATASADTVKFNGTVAAVTSATTSQIVATVPIGATTGPISVTVKGKTATSSTSFTVATGPVITTVFPQSALFNAMIPNSQVTGVGLLGAVFSFSAPGPQVALQSVNATGTSATLTFTAGATAGTYALVATNPYGNSGIVATAANRFTVVDPSLTDTTMAACGLPDVVVAAYGLDPLNPNACPTSTMQPLSGEADTVPFSVLDTAGAPGSDQATEEVDALPVSVLNTAAPAGSPAATMEADGICFSVWNDPGGPPSGLMCGNPPPGPPQVKDGSKKGATHASSTKASKH
jgi:YD repeat-containing protein